MAADEPPYLTVGTDVSAKYKGAFCEAKIKKVSRMVKCKVTFKNNLGSSMIPDDQIRGNLRIGSEVEARHPEKNQYLEAVINKLQDYSQYTVVFDDGDETTLRRTSLCLKSGRHFAESPTLDQFPLTNPEHFGTPVIGSAKSKRKRRSTMNSASLDYDSSDEEYVVKKPKSGRGKEKDPDFGKVVCVDFGDRRKKDSWYPGLVVSNPSSDSFKVNPKDEYLIRSFKDGKYYQVPRKDTREFTREIGQRVESHTLRTAVEKALLYCEEGELPPHWDKAFYLGIDLASGEDESHDTDSDISDNEPSEKKDRFVAQLYKFMDDRGTPINKAPAIGNQDLNLYKLFKIVHKMGGYNRVTNQNKWKMVYTKLGLPSSNTAGANQIKSAYKRLLHSFEDFNRKLGCTMVTNSRSTRGRHRSDRNFVITRNRDRETSSPKRRTVNKDTKEKNSEKKSDEKPKIPEKKEVKAKSDESAKSEEKHKPPAEKKKSDKTKVEEKDTKSKLKKEEKPRLARSLSLTKGKRENKDDDDKKDSSSEKARTREDTRKSKTESPEKKETRSSAKFEQEREKKEKEELEKKEADVSKDKKELRFVKEKKDEKLSKEVKEEKVVKEKKDDKVPSDKKVEKQVKEKKEEKLKIQKDKSDVSKEKKDVVIKDKKDDKSVKEKNDKKDKPKDERNKKDEKIKKSKVEEKVLKPENEETNSSTSDKKDVKIILKDKKDDKLIKKEDHVKEKRELKNLKLDDKPVIKEIEEVKEIKPEKLDITCKENDGDDSKNPEPMNPEPLHINLKEEPEVEFSKPEDKDDVKSLVGLSDSDYEEYVLCGDKDDREIKGEIEIGDKVKVKYGRGRTQKVYEAKVLKVEIDSGEKRYYVHYAGWNTRYDEWVRRSYILENMSERVRNARKKKQDMCAKDALSFGQVKKNDKTQPFGPPKMCRKSSTSSTNSSTVSLSRMTRSDKKSLQTSPYSGGLEPRRRMRKKSGLALTDTSQESESDYDALVIDDDDDDEIDDDESLNHSKSDFKDEMFSDIEDEKDKLENKIDHMLLLQKCEDNDSVSDFKQVTDASKNIDLFQFNEEEEQQDKHAEFPVLRSNLPDNLLDKFRNEMNHLQNRVTSDTDKHQNVFSSNKTIQNMSYMKIDAKAPVLTKIENVSENSKSEVKNLSLKIEEKEEANKDSGNKFSEFKQYTAEKINFPASDFNLDDDSQTVESEVDKNAESKSDSEQKSDSISSNAKQDNKFESAIYVKDLLPVTPSNKTESLNIDDIKVQVLNEKKEGNIAELKQEICANTTAHKKNSECASNSSSNFPPKLDLDCSSKKVNDESLKKVDSVSTVTDAISQAIPEKCTESSFVQKSEASSSVVKTEKCVENTVISSVSSKERDVWKKFTSTVFPPSFFSSEFKPEKDSKYQKLPKLSRDCTDYFPSVLTESSKSEISFKKSETETVFSCSTGNNNAGNAGNNAGNNNAGKTVMPLVTGHVTVELQQQLVIVSSAPSIVAPFSSRSTVLVSDTKVNTDECSKPNVMKSDPFTCFSKTPVSSITDTLLSKVPTENSVLDLMNKNPKKDPESDVEIKSQKPALENPEVKVSIAFKSPSALAFPTLSSNALAAPNKENNSKQESAVTDQIAGHKLPCFNVPSVASAVDELKNIEGKVKSSVGTAVDEKPSDSVVKLEEKDLDDTIREGLIELSIGGKEKSMLLKNPSVSVTSLESKNVFLNVCQEKSVSVKSQKEKLIPNRENDFPPKIDFIESSGTSEKSVILPEVDKKQPSPFESISAANKEMLELNVDKCKDVDKSVAEEDNETAPLPTTVTKKEAKKKKSKLSKQERKLGFFDGSEREEKCKEGKSKSKKKSKCEDDFDKLRDSDLKPKSKKIKKNKNKKRFARFDESSGNFLDDDNRDNAFEKIRKKEKRKREEKKLLKSDAKHDEAEDHKTTKSELFRKEKKKGKKNKDKMAADKKLDLMEKKMKKRKRNHDDLDSDSDKDILRPSEKKKKKEKKKLRPKECSSSDDAADMKLFKDREKNLSFMSSEKLEKNDDPDMSFLLCEEKVPASPVGASAVNEDTSGSSSLDENSNNNKNGSSDDERAPQLNDVFSRSEVLDVMNKHNVEACAVLDNTPPTTPSSTESLLSSSPPHERESYSLNYPESTRSGRDSGGESDSYQCGLNQTKIRESEEYRAAATLAYAVCKSVTEKKECGRPRIKRQKSTESHHSPGKRKKKNKRSHGSTDTQKSHVKHKSMFSRASKGENCEIVSDSSNASNLTITSPFHGSTSSITPFSHSTPHHSITSSDSVSASTRPSKCNLSVPLHEFKDPEKRISVLQEKMTELRKLYSSLKAEVAMIDRRRKKAKKKIKEAGAATSLPPMQFEERQVCS